MPQFDPTVRDLILAGDTAEATEALRLGHPPLTLETLGSFSELMGESHFSTSSSSATIGLGALSITLASPREWPIGTPVVIIDSSNAGNLMYGQLTTATGAGGVLDVNITGTRGSGTFTLWTVIVTLAVTSVAAPPVTLADGGWGADISAEPAQETQKRLLRIGTFLNVQSVLSTPPGSPSVGDLHVVGPAPSGAWVGLEDYIVRWNGATWSTFDWGAGTRVYVEDAGIFFSRSGGLMMVQGANPGGGLSDGIWEGSRWRHTNQSGQPTARKVIEQVAASRAYSVDERGAIVVVDATAGNRTITLPRALSGAVIGQEWVIVRVDASINTVTVNVSGGGLINGVASVVIPSGWGRHVISGIGLGGIVDYAY